MNNRPKASLALAAAVAMTLVSATSGAQEAEQGLDYSLRAGVGHTDNLGRDENNPVDSVFYSLGGTLRYFNQQGRVDSDISLDLDWQDYDAQGYDSQLWGNARARVNYSFVPDRLVWVFQNDFGQGNRNPIESASPDNVENINYFTTGPEWTVRLGDAMGATLDAKYSNVWYEDSPNNSDRYSGGLMLFRDLSSSSRAYVRANYEDVQFDSGALAPDFTQTDLLAGYNNQGARTRILAEAGYSELETDAGTQDGPMFRLNVDHDLTAALRAQLRLGQEFNDAARDIRSQGDFGTDPNGVLSDGQAYEDRYAEVVLRFNKSRTEISGGVRYNDQDYVSEDDLDRERLEFNARLQRRVGRDWTAYLDAQYESVDYVINDVVDYDETELGAGVGWTPTQKLSFNLMYRYRTRPNSSVNSFDENFVWLRADWSPAAGADVLSALMLNAMTIDVEDYFHVAAFADQVSPGQWSSHEYRAVANTEKLLDIFAGAGVRATFFFLGWVAERSPGLVRAVATAGHEVACHGYSHQLVFSQGRELFARETRRAKSFLEDTLGQPVRGYRAASFSITPRSSWALDVLAEAGFEYDSSIAPMRHDIYGWPDGPSVPGKINTPSGASLVEFPVMLARLAGASLPVAGGGYFRILPYPLITGGLRNINNTQGQPFFFYLHPWEVDPQQPRIAGASLKSRLRHYTGLDSCETKLRRLLGEFRFGAMEDVLADLLPAR